MKNQNLLLNIFVFVLLFLSYLNSSLQNDKSFSEIDGFELQVSNSPDSQIEYNNSNIKSTQELINNLELEVYTEINEYRMKQGLNKLKLDNRINQIAKNYSIRMAEKEIPFDKKALTETILIEEFMPYQSISEAISYNFGYPNPARVTVNSWISDPEIINAIQGNYEFTGIGVARSVTGEYYFTQIFVNPL